MVFLRTAASTGAPPPAAPTRAKSRRGRSAPTGTATKGSDLQANEQLIDVMPAGLIVFPGTGIQDNLVDKARAFGIPVWDFRIRDPASGADLDLTALAIGQACDHRRKERCVTISTISRPTSSANWSA